MPARGCCIRVRGGEHPRDTMMISHNDWKSLLQRIHKENTLTDNTKSVALHNYSSSWEPVPHHLSSLPINQFNLHCENYVRQKGSGYYTSRFIMIRWNWWRNITTFMLHSLSLVIRLKLAKCLKTRADKSWQKDEVLFSAGYNLYVVYL